MNGTEPKDECDNGSDSRPSVAAEEDEGYANFRDLNAEDWREWLDGFLDGDPRPPLVAVTNEESQQILIRVFDHLEGKPSRLFKRALFDVFESTPITRKNERQLYYILHVLAYCVPVEAKGLLRRRLREGIFRRLSYGKQNLHSLLLVACSKYHVDDELVEYVERSARASRDYDYLLLCQWVLSTRQGPKAYYFIERLLPLMTSDEKATAFEKAAALSRQLISIGKRIGYKDFLDWYRLRSEHLASNCEQQWPILIDALQKRLLSDRALPALAQQDKDAVSLYAELRTSQDLIPLETVLAISRLHVHLGVEDTSVILFDIWKAIYDRSGEIPWDYVAASEKQGAMTRIAVGAICRLADDPLDEVRLQRFEPNTEKVLIQVRSLYEPLLPAKTQVAGQRA